MMPNGVVQQVQPWMIELQGEIKVGRLPDGMRVLEVVHPSGAIAARLTLDPINAMLVAKGLAPGEVVP